MPFEMFKRHGVKVAQLKGFHLKGFPLKGFRLKTMAGQWKSQFRAKRLKKQFLLLSILGTAALLMGGCWLTGLPSQETTAIASRVPGQVLPISATAVIGRETFKLEVAQTPQQQAMGLMYRTFLPPNRGMLFPFRPAQQVSFWMKHCRISLDMIFLREGKVVAIIENAPPCTAEPCPTYGPKDLVDQVIEVRGGRTASLGLKVGTPIKIQWLKQPQ